MAGPKRFRLSWKNIEDERRGATTNGILFQLSLLSSPATLLTTILVVDSSSVFINRVLDNGCVLLQPKITLLSSSESMQQSSRPIALALELLPVVIYLLVVKTCLQNVWKTNLTFIKLEKKLWYILTANAVLEVSNMCCTFNCIFFFLPLGGVIFNLSMAQKLSLDTFDFAEKWSWLIFWVKTFWVSLLLNWHLAPRIGKMRLFSQGLEMSRWVSSSQSHSYPIHNKECAPSYQGSVLLNL